MPTNQLGDRVRELRLGNGLSQRELAAQVNVGFPYISKVENGLEVPGEDTLVAIAKALGVEADGLLLLADRIPSEVADIIRSKKVATTFLRKWKSGEISDAEVERLINPDGWR